MHPHTENEVPRSSQVVAAAEKIVLKTRSNFINFQPHLVFTMVHIPTKLHQSPISSFGDFLRTDAQTDAQTPPETIPARSIAGTQVTSDLQVSSLSHANIPETKRDKAMVTKKPEQEIWVPDSESVIRFATGSSLRFCHSGWSFDRETRKWRNRTSGGERVNLWETYKEIILETKITGQVCTWR